MPRYFHIITGAVVVLLVVCSSVSLSAAPLPDAIRALERDGRFDDAKRLLASIRDDDASKHAALLADVERVETIANDYATERRFAEAQRALGGLLPTLDPVRDSYLVLRVERDIDRFRRAYRSQQEQDAVAMLDRADGLYARGAYTRAQGVYAVVAMQSADDVGAEVVARAKRGVAKAQRAALDDEPQTLYDEVVHPLPAALHALAIWVTWFVVLAVAFVMLRLLHGRLFTRDGHVVNLVDLTAVPEMRPAANHELSRTLIQMMHRIGRAEPRASTLQAAAAQSTAHDEWIPGERLPFLDPTPDAPALSTFTEFVQAAPTLQVGPIGIDPRQVLEFGQALFKRRYRHTLTGTLFEHDGLLILHAAMYDRMKPMASPWHASVQASAGRASCLADVAAQIVVAMATGTTVLTSNAESLRQYVAGLDALAATTSEPASLAPARDAFQRALSADRDNWLARFHLAVVLRRLGDPAAAIYHLRTLREQPSESLRRHLAVRPDFDYLVQYQLGSALTQTGGRDEINEAATFFGALIELKPTDNGALKPYVMYLRMLGRSGETSRLLADVDDSNKGPVLDRVSAHEQWFQAHANELMKEWPDDYQIARGVVKYGFGRLQYLHGNYREAIKPLKEATMLVPDFADAFVNLAQVHLKWKEKTADDWPRCVRAALDRALAIDPNHDKAKYIYAKFYVSDAGRDLPKAESLLRQCALHPSTLFLLGQVLADREQFAEALDALDRSLSLDDRADYRLQLYAKTMLDLVRAKGSMRTIGRARERFVGYMKTEKDRKDIDRLNGLMKQIDDAIAAANTPAARPAAEVQART